MAVWIIGGIGMVLLLLVLAIACPVGYEGKAGREGGWLHIRCFGGLYTKNITWPGAGEADRPGEDLPKESRAEAAEGDPPPAAIEKRESSGAAPSLEPVKKEEPLCLSPDGRAARQAGPEESTIEAQGEGTAQAGGEEGSIGKWALFRYAWQEGAIKAVLGGMGRLFRHCRPRVLRITGRAGLGDPMQTGAAAGALYAALPGCVRLDWDYTERCCDITITARGRICPLYVLYIAAQTLLSSSVRRTRRYWKIRKQAGKAAS